MTLSHRSMCAAALGTVLALPAAAHEVVDSTIKRSPRDSAVRMYGAGGPDTAFKKVAAAFAAQTGIEVEVTGGPEPTWSRKAQADADVIWGTADQDITALVETYTNFAWAGTTEHGRDRGGAATRRVHRVPLVSTR